MALKELLGDKYSPDMAVADAEKLLEGKRLADLSTGEYVSKAKYEAVLLKRVLRHTLHIEETNSLQNNVCKLTFLGIFGKIKEKILKWREA